MKCDIIIPVWNQLAFTKDCIESIAGNTESGYRIIVIDNASGEETRRYLETLSNDSANHILLIRNVKNLGFVKAVNQGIAASDAERICLLNNDTLVTKDWLREMLQVADSEKDIGIVNPSSNNLGQRPSNGEPISLYAEKLKEQSGKFLETGASIGFCMLIKREVIDKIGVFDEIYGMGNFEDTDFSRRAIREGYRCVRACGAYVYHRENSSFNKIRTFEEDFKRNREIYEFRWGRPRRIAYIMDSCDENEFKKFEKDAMKLARGGNWVWYFLKKDIELPRHSNIIGVNVPAEKFYISTIFRILKKKKKFDEILVGEERFGKLLERLSFIHKAKVHYY